MPADITAQSSSSDLFLDSAFDFMTKSLGSGEFNYSYNVSLEKKYVYIENAKAACTTIKASLGSAELKNAGLGKTFAEMYTKDVHRNVLGTPFLKPYQLGKEFFDRIIENNAFTVFTFVKNPFSRILSAYLDKVVRKLPDSAGIYAAANKTFEDELTFLEYLQTIRGLLESGKRIDKHFRPQFLQCGQGNIRLDFVGRVEDFEVDFQALAKRIGCPAIEIIMGVSHSTKAPNLLAEFYGVEEADIVRNSFKSDFEVYGYDLDIPGNKYLEKAYRA